MDKYQSILLFGEPSHKMYSCYCVSVKDGCHIEGYIDCETDSYTLKQEEDIDSTKYTFGVQAIPVIAKCYYLKNGTWHETKEHHNMHVCELDFNNRVKKYKICFKDNMADDYIFSFIYQEIDKDAYYAKQEQQKKDDLLKAASIKHSTGNDLVNIYFQPCSDEYERTEITLFKDGQMLAKYKVDDGVFFKSISGLAYGTYEYVVKQYAKGDKLLLETDKIKFSISAPFYGGKNIVFN